MKVKWLGHSSFLITSEAGIKIITDPYFTGRGVNYGEIEEVADIVTISHGHNDHCNVAAVQGNPAIVKEIASVEIKGMKFNGIPAFHDDAGGSSRGDNIIFYFEIDGMVICHLGDLGHRLSDRQVAELGKVDILIIPVGGFFTIDATVTTEVCRQLAPGVIIPMHYKNDKLGPEFPIANVEDFLKGKEGVVRLDTSEVEFKKGELPATTQIIVLQPAL